TIERERRRRIEAPEKAAEGAPRLAADDVADRRDPGAAEKAVLLVRDDGAEQTLDATAVRVLRERAAPRPACHGHALLGVREVMARQLSHLGDCGGDRELMLVEERRQEGAAVDDLER